MDGPLARPDHEGKVDDLCVIAVTTFDFKQLVSAVQRIRYRWRRLIRTA